MKCEKVDLGYSAPSYILGAEGEGVIDMNGIVRKVDKRSRCRGIRGKQGREARETSEASDGTSDSSYPTRGCTGARPNVPTRVYSKLLGERDEAAAYG